jgi:hypothetical protein
MEAANADPDLQFSIGGNSIKTLRKELINYSNNKGINIYGGLTGQDIIDIYGLDKPRGNYSISEQRQNEILLKFFSNPDYVNKVKDDVLGEFTHEQHEYCLNLTNEFLSQVRPKVNENLYFLLHFDIYKEIVNKIIKEVSIVSLDPPYVKSNGSMVDMSCICHLYLPNGGGDATEEPDGIFKLYGSVQNIREGLKLESNRINNSEEQKYWKSEENSGCSKRTISLIDIIITYFKVIISDTYADVRIDDNYEDRTGEIIESDLIDAFQKNPYTLDSRQFLTVQRFTTFKKDLEDKACFLFHGVGTGKTITSLSMSTYYLSDKNKFIYNEANETKEAFKVLVFAPQGLFLNAFKDDLENQGAYIYNTVVNEYGDKDEDKNITLETFTACLKPPGEEGNKDTPPQEYYKIEFTGLDYLSFFKKDSLVTLPNVLGEGNKYDVLICDEAHKIVTDPLKFSDEQKNKSAYTINMAGEGKENSANMKTVPDDEIFPAISNYEFVNFIQTRIEHYSIFLTGTPLQKSTWDVLRILKFLNLRQINKSNIDNLYNDVQDNISNLEKDIDFFFNSTADTEDFGNLLSNEESVYHRFTANCFKKLQTTEISDLEEGLLIDGENITMSSVNELAREILESTTPIVNQNLHGGGNRKGRKSDIFLQIGGNGDNNPLSLFPHKQDEESEIIQIRSFVADNGKGQEMSKLLSDINRNRIQIGGATQVVNMRNLFNAIEVDTKHSDNNTREALKDLITNLVNIKNSSILRLEENGKNLPKYILKEGNDPLKGAKDVLFSVMEPETLTLTEMNITENQMELQAEMGGKNKKTYKSRKKFNRKKTLKNKKGGGGSTWNITELNEKTRELLNDPLWVKEAGVIVSALFYNTSRIQEYVAEQMFLSSISKTGALNIDGDVVEGQVPSTHLTQKENKFNQTISETILAYSIRSRILAPPTRNSTSVEIEELPPEEGTKPEEGTQKVMDGGGRFDAEKLDLLRKQMMGAITGLFNLLWSSGGRMSAAEATEAVMNALGNTIKDLGVTVWNIMKGIGKLISDIFCTLATLMFNNGLWGPGTWNYDRIVRHLLPFISVYNYEYIEEAIDDKKYYNNMLENSFSVDHSEVNREGTKNRFPESYIENIYMPLNKVQIDLADSEFTQIMNREYSQNNTYSLIDKYLKKDIEFDTNKSKNFEISYIISNLMSNLSCQAKSFTHEQYTELANNYKRYYNNEIERIIQEYKDNYKDLDTKKGRWQKKTNVNEKHPLEYSSGDISKTLDTLDTNYNIEKFKDDRPKTGENGKDSAFGINISSSFDKSIDEINYSFVETIISQSFPEGGLPENPQNNGQRDTVVKRLTTNLDENIIKQNQERGREDIEKFDNVIKLLKIIRSGVILHKEKYVLHPHYVMDKQSIQYYLPLIYPPTKEIMYTFAYYLNNKRIRFIWMDNKMDPLFLEKQVDAGRILTSPITKFDEENENPVCILLSPNHKEGFSFVFNPCLISLGLSDTAGDEEQIYGRILRKYGDGPKERKGTYDKKIYQYFTGGSLESNFLKYTAWNYSSSDKTTFRYYEDKKTYVSTTMVADTKKANNSLLIKPLYSACQMIEQNWNGIVKKIDLNTFISLDTVIEASLQRYRRQYGNNYNQISRLNPVLEEAVAVAAEDGDILGVVDESSKTKLGDIVKVDGEYYLKSENRQPIPIGEIIDTPGLNGAIFFGDSFTDAKSRWETKLRQSIQSNEGYGIAEFYAETQFKLLYKARQSNLQFFNIIASVENSTVKKGWLESIHQTVFESTPENPFIPLDLQFIRSSQGNYTPLVDYDYVKETYSGLGGYMGMAAGVLGTAYFLGVTGPSSLVPSFIGGNLGIGNMLGLFMGGNFGAQIGKGVARSGYSESNIKIKRKEEEEGKEDATKFCLLNIDPSNFMNSRGILNLNSFILCLKNCSDIPCPTQECSLYCDVIHTTETEIEREKYERKKEACKQDKMEWNNRRKICVPCDPLTRWDDYEEECVPITLGGNKKKIIKKMTKKNIKKNKKMTKKNNNKNKKSLKKLILKKSKKLYN